ncbi:MAG TPA: hypothetical protein EYP39_05560 [Ghiorsea sp.]|nr:hypothetical protein [Ghiorsea sp.]
MDKQVSQIRRKLLKAAIYAPPVILGSMVATPRTVMGISIAPPPTSPIGSTQTCSLFAGGTVTITISSGTNACCPCVPGAIGFNNVRDCNLARCELSCGTNCAPGVLATVKCKDFCKSCGFTVAGCLTACTCNATTGACP